MSAMAPISADFVTPCSSSSSSSASDPASTELRNSTNSSVAVSAPTSNSIAHKSMVASVTKGAHEAAPGSPGDLRVAPKLSPNGTTQNAAKMPDGLKPASRAGRILMLKRKRKDRWRKSANEYKDCMAELFYLQSNQPLQDLPTFRKKPSVQFINFLKSNNAPAEILKEVQLAVGVIVTTAPTSTAPTVTSSSGAGTTSVSSKSNSISTSARPSMSNSQLSLTTSSGATPVLAAAAAQHQTPGRTLGSQNRLLKVGASSSASISSGSPSPSNPYLFSDVGPTRKPEPFRRSTTSSTSSGLTRQESTLASSTATQNLASQPLTMQEPVVTGRVRELIKEGLWSQKRIPKVCERPRSKTHWDFLLNEVQWLAVDFHQERTWKKSVAKMLAYSAKEFVEGWEQRKQRERIARERQVRQKAALVASEVLRFWDGVSDLAGKPKVASDDRTSDRVVFNRVEAVTSLGINGIADSDEDLDNDDDESTISEQERFEMSGGDPVVSSSDEIKALQDESAQPLDSLRVPESFEVVNNDIDGEESESDSELNESSTDSSDSSDSDDCDYSPEFFNELLDASSRIQEKVVCVPLHSRQRSLYNDCLSEPRNQSALCNGEIKDVARILTQLRQICNYPQLQQSDTSSPKDLTFPRVPDLALATHPKLTSALDFDPFTNIDLNSHNLIFLTHETAGLTAISVDRIRRVCAPKRLIEELPARPASPPPSVPRGRFALEITPNFQQSGATAPRNLARSLSVNCTQLPWDKNGGSSSSKSTQPSGAFHSESLSLIARFNERRCRGMPLYGQDLISSLTVVDLVKPTRSQFRGNGWVNCLNAMTEKRSVALGKRRNYGEFKYKTSALARLCRDVQNTRIGDRDEIDAGKEAFVLRLFSAAPTVSTPIHLVPGFSQTVNKLEARISPVLCQLSHDYNVPVQVPDLKPAQCVSPDLGLTLNNRFSAKLQQLDVLLDQIRRRRERVLVLVEMDDMLAILRQYLQSRHFPFVYLDPSANKSVRQRQMARFAKRSENACLLTSSTASCRGVAELLTSNVSNVVFYDSSPCLAPKEASRWIRILKRSSRSTLTLYRLVCEGTVENNLSRKALQEKLLIDLRKSPENGFMWRIKKQTLDDLFEIHDESTTDDKVVECVYVRGSDAQKVHSLVDEEEDNKGLIRGQLPLSSLPSHGRKGDLEALIHLNWLWNNGEGDPVKLFKEFEVESSSEDETSNEIANRGNKKLKAIERYGLKCIDDLLATPVDVMVIKDDMELEAEKQAWEDRFTTALAKLADEIEYLDSLPCLTYSTEDANKSWHAQDGQPMPLWAAPAPPAPSAPSVNLETELIDHYLNLVYKRELMTDEELPPVFFKREAAAHLMLNAGGSALAGGSSVAAMGGIGTLTVGGIKRSASDAGLSPQIPGTSGDGMGGNYEIRPKLKREDGGTGIMPPRSLFDRPANLQNKMRRDKMPNFKQRPPTVAPGATPGGGPGQPPPSIASLRHPLPKPQVDAENAPEWLIQEDWALLHAVRELLDLPLNLLTNSAAHTPNWDMVSDMVNSVSRIYRGPRQCKIRYESIIVPREEGRISLDGTGTPPLPNVVPPIPLGSSNKIKKGQKNQKSGLKTPIIPSLKPRAQGTSVKFNQDNNRTYSNLMSNRFAHIKAVANKRTPTTKPLMLNPATSKNSNNAQVLADAGIGYETPLSPIRVAANRAERIAKEKQRAHEQQVSQQQRLAAQNAANVAQQHAAATAANRQGGAANAVAAAVVPTPSAQSIATAVVQQHQQQQQPQQAQAIATAAGGTQAVVVGISQPTSGNVGGQVIVGSPATISRLQAQKHIPNSQAQNQQQVADIAARAVASGAVTSQAQGNAVIVSSNMVVTSQQPSVVSVAGQLQLQNPQKLNQSIGTIPRVVNQGAITPQQLAMLKQKTLQKQQQQHQLQQHIQNRQTVVAAGNIPAGTTVVGATTSTGQKVSVAVTPGANLGSVGGANVAVSSVAGGMNAVTVVTQALTGTSKGQLIRQLSTGGNKNIRPLNENELKLIMTKQQIQQGGTGKAQLTSIAVPAGHSGQLTAQLLQQHGIQIQPSASAGGPQVATLVKTVTANSQQQQQQGHAAGNVVHPQNIIPVNMNLPAGAMKAIRGGQVTAGNQQQMQLLRGQVFQHRGGAKAGMMAGTVAGQPKVALSQVGGKGVPAQLIVSSGGISGQKGQLPQAVTVQQIQQIVKQQPGGLQQLNTAQGIMPHTVLTKQGGPSGVVGSQSGSTVQARVIPVSSTGGRTQHIQVVTASSASSPAVVATLANRVAAGNAVNAVGGSAVSRTAAPNVTIDTSGLPTGTNSQLANALTSNIRVTTSGGVSSGQQFLNQVNYVGGSGQSLSVAVRTPMGLAQTQQQGQQQQVQQKLHVVTASQQQATNATGQQQQQQQKDLGK